VEVEFLLGKMLQISAKVLAVANPMSSHTCLAGIFLAFDEHFEQKNWRREGSRQVFMD
jgi:hypothetical protein